MSTVLACELGHTSMQLYSHQNVAVQLCTVNGKEK